MTPPHGRADRIPLRIRVSYEHLDDFLDDYSSNVSMGGMFVRSERPLPVGTRFRLRFEVPGRQKPVDTVGEVRWVIPADDPSGMTPGMGVQFEPLSIADQRDVARWLADSRP